MNTSQFPLAHPLSCLDRARVHEDAAQGRLWKAQRDNVIMNFPGAIALLLMGIVGACLVFYGPVAPPRSALYFSVALILFAGVKGATNLVRGIKELRALSAMPRHRLPEEMRIARNLYFELNAGLAMFYQRQLLPRYANREATSADGITLLAATDELVRLDGLLYVIGQQHNDLDACSDAVRERDLGHAITRLLNRELPKVIAEPAGLAI